ncbi:hypothetical protein ABZX65_07785 [Streptomyces sp. NPDC003300]|uniref:hypothetical protein n=1 Tax=unclassified Streptomyces TaxID=2593676 RepID=UPI0033AA0552
MMSEANPGAAARPPRWMPIGEEADLCAAGRWWDAIRAPETIGRRAIAFLVEAGQQLGPVILDDGGPEPRMYFLASVGASEGWDEPATVALGRSCHVVVPPAHRISPPGLHWHSLPTQPRVFARADSLRRALAKARKEQQGPSFPPSPAP